MTKEEELTSSRRRVVTTREDDDMADVMAERYAGRAGHFSGLPEDVGDMEDGEKLDGKRRRPKFIPAKSIEGWIVIVTEVHEEAQEENILEAFEQFGEIKNIHLNLDRRTGYVKGYALVEFGEKKQAENAIIAMNGSRILEKTVRCDWAFIKAPRRTTN